MVKKINFFAYFYNLGSWKWK